MTMQRAPVLNRVIYERTERTVQQVVPAGTWRFDTIELVGGSIPSLQQGEWRITDSSNRTFSLTTPVNQIIAEFDRIAFDALDADGQDFPPSTDFQVDDVLTLTFAAHVLQLVVSGDAGSDYTVFEGALTLISGDGSDGLSSPAVTVTEGVDTIDVTVTEDVVVGWAGRLDTPVSDQIEINTQRTVAILDSVFVTRDPSSWARRLSRFYDKDGVGYTVRGVTKSERYGRDRFLEVLARNIG